MSNKEIDRISGTETTGHEWDGIKELNTPLPRWWLWTFYATVIWSLGYVIAYPAWPLISSNTKGLLGYSSRADLTREMAAAEADKAEITARIAQADVAEIAADEELSRFAIASGRSLFKVYCSQCHGSGAQGAAGYPNLNDDDWIWGGSIDAIFATITHGVRYGADPDTRVSEMPAFGRDGILTGEEIDAVGNYVLALAGREHDAAKAETGATVYADNCAACHGETGKGNPEVGAPNIADAIWLYSDKPADVIAQIGAPRHGVMPAWGSRLGDTKVKELAVYVHSLGGGE